MMIRYGLTKKARQQISNTGLLRAFFCRFSNLFKYLNVQFSC